MRAKGEVRSRDAFRRAELRVEQRDFGHAKPRQYGRPEPFGFRAKSGKGYLLEVVRKTAKAIWSLLIVSSSHCRCAGAEKFAHTLCAAVIAETAFVMDPTRSQDTFQADPCQICSDPRGSG